MVDIREIAMVLNWARKSMVDYSAVPKETHRQDKDVFDLLLDNNLRP